MEARSTPRTTSTGRSAASRGSIVPKRASHHTSGVSSLSASSTTIASGSRSARSRTACSTRTTCTYGSDGNRSGSRESTMLARGRDLGAEGDQVPDRARTRDLQCRSQHLRALDDVLARPRPGHGLQRSAPRLATDHAEPEPSQVGGGLAQHRGTTGLRRSGHDDDLAHRPVGPGVAPRIHDLLDDVREVPRVAVRPVGHACPSRRPVLERVIASLPPGDGRHQPTTGPCGGIGREGDTTRGDERPHPSCQRTGVDRTGARGRSSPGPGGRQESHHETATGPPSPRHHE